MIRAILTVRIALIRRVYGDELALSIMVERGTDSLRRNRLLTDVAVDDDAETFLAATSSAGRSISWRFFTVLHQPKCWVQCPALLLALPSFSPVDDEIVDVRR